MYCVCSRLGQISSDCSRLGVCHASTPTSIINNSSSENGLCQLCPEGAAGREGDRGGASEDQRLSTAWSVFVGAGDAGSPI